MDTPRPHIVLVTTGSAGDLFPFLAMGTALQERGERVTLFAPALHEPMVRQAGLPFHPSFADPAVLADPDLWHPRRGFGVVWRAVRPGLAELRALVLSLPPGPVLIVAHPLAVPDADLCRALRAGVRVAAAYLAPSNIPTVHDPLLIGPLAVPRWVPHAARRWLWKQVAARFIDPVALPDINAQRRAHGLAPLDKLLDFLRTAPDLSLTLFPEWFGARQPDWPQPLVAGNFALYDPAPELDFSPELLRFLAGGAAPLVFTPGTGNQQAEKYFSVALEAARVLRRRAIFLTPHRAQVADSLPPTVLWQAYCPLHQLLPYAAAVVHHGGIGTTAEALRAGVPQLVVPLAFDQFDNGARVEALGAGLVLRHARLTPRRLALKLRTLGAARAIAARCRDIASRMKSEPGLGNVADALRDAMEVAPELFLHTSGRCRATVTQTNEE